MCIGLPMRVTALEPGHARCAGRGETRWVRTALVGDPGIGDWLLVFVDSAVEIIDAQRAAEISATLDLLALVDAGLPCEVPAAFALPSAMSREQLMALAGERSPAGPQS
jgi:hydrogenase expression/formation protein HypC